MKSQLISFSIFVFFFACRIQAQTEWSKATILADGHIDCVVVSGDTILAGAVNGRVLRSTDRGLHWRSVPVASAGIGQVTSLAKIGSDVYAGTWRTGLFKSTDCGETWKICPTNTEMAISSFAVKDSQLIIVDGGLWLPSDGGKNWTSVKSFIMQFVLSVAVDGAYLFASTYYSGVLRSSDGGQTWTKAMNGLSDTIATILKADGANLWAGTNTGVFLSTDHGESWKAMNTGVPAGQVTALAVNGSTVYAGIRSHGVYQSLDNGKSWNAIDSTAKIPEVFSLTLDGTRLYAGTRDGVWSLDIQRKEWSAFTTGLPYAGTGGGYTYCFGAIDSVLVAGDIDLGNLRSTDGGLTWTQSNRGMGGLTLLQWSLFLGETYPRSFAVVDSFLFAGTEYGLFRSDDKGRSWGEVNIGEPKPCVNALTAVDSFLLVGTNEGLFRSSDKGKTWNAVNTGLPDGRMWRFASIGTTLFANVLIEPPLRHLSGVYRSNDHGANWTLANTSAAITGIDYSDLGDLFVAQGTIYANAWDRVVWSTDSGAHWTSTARMPGSSIEAVAVFDSIIIVGTYAQAIYLSSDHGAHWRMADLGLTDIEVNTVDIFNMQVFAGTHGGIWHRSLDKITKVDERRGTIPLQFALEQNFPNPFNPSTTIAFSIPSKLPVTLKIFDVMGREVATLVSEELPAGTYQRQWNASGMSSGMYFYRLRAGAFTETKRLMFVK